MHSISFLRAILPKETRAVLNSSVTSEWNLTAAFAHFIAVMSKFTCTNCVKIPVNPRQPQPRCHSSAGAYHKIEELLPSYCLHRATTTVFIQIDAHAK